MPENEQIQRILSKHTFNYFICKQIIEILKETERHSKNLFGYYSSQRMKDWQEIVQAYQKDGIYLAELAATLIRNVTYEVPNLKRTIGRMQQLHDEYNRKQDEYLKQSAALRKEYNQMAQSHGLNGSNIEADLEQLFGEVPAELATLEHEIAGVRSIRQLYLSFVERVNGQESAGLLPLLGYLLERGNTTYFEYANGVKPVEVIEDKLDLKRKPVGGGEQTDGDKIDFGDEIDFGEEDAQIDFGDQIDFGTGEDKIDFRTEGEKVAEDAAASNESKGSNVAKGKDALTILEHFKTRNLILNELYEIEAFLRQRVVESKTQENSLIASQLEESPELVDLFNVNFLESSLSVVQHIISLLNQDKIKMLCLIKDNEKWVLCGLVCASINRIRLSNSCFFFFPRPFQQVLGHDPAEVQS